MTSFRMAQQHCIHPYKDATCTKTCLLHFLNCIIRENDLKQKFSFKHIQVSEEVRTDRSNYKSQETKMLITIFITITIIIITIIR